MTMPVPPAQNPAPAPAPADPAPVPAQPPAPAPAAPAPADNAPKWDGPFDAERAARLVENLRSDVQSTKDALAAAQAKVTQYEQASMSEQERTAQALTTAETQLAEAHRKLAMLTHKLPESAAEFLTATTPEDIEAQAKRLAETFPAASPADNTPTLPPTLPVPGNGSDPAATSQLTREQFDALTPPQRMAAYREGRTRDIGGR